MIATRRLAPLVLLHAFACGTDDAADQHGDTTGVDTGSPSGTDAPPTSGAETCAPLVACDGACVDVEVDPDHCGDCETTCAEGLACIDGVCGVACGPGSTACGDRCTDTTIDPAHCGGCDLACAPSVPCIAGTCTPTCTDDTQDCGGVCVAVDNDEAHCGGCDTPCAEGQPCVFGQCVATTLHHLLVTGQSLSTGSGSQVVSVEQPFANVMFSNGVRAGGTNLVAFAPLVEVFGGGEGETIASGFANLLTESTGGAGVGLRSLVSAHGIGGQPYTVLRKGTAAYANGMAQVGAANILASARSESFAVRAMAVIHGETDHNLGNQAYDQNLLEWQDDYDNDVRAITGQLAPVVMFTDQMSSFTALGSATSTIPQQQLAAAKARPDRIFVVAPKYMLGYVPDGVHLTGDSERWLGELYAKAWRRVLVDGERWSPLAPRTIERNGSVITVDFEVPAPPLVLDTTLVTDPGNYGFVFVDNSGAPPAIESVSLVDEDTVQIDLADAPTGGNERLLYAMIGTPGAAGGPTTGARGNLRDSDTTPSRHGYLLYDWCVHFDEPVTVIEPPLPGR